MRSNLKNLALVAACAAASLAASQCASPKNSRTAAVADSPGVGRLAPATWTRQSTPDSIAQWVRRGCGARVVHQDDCIEKALVSVIEPAGVDKAMAALLLLSKDVDVVSRDGHVFAHGIGIAAYKSPETVGQTFALCTGDFQSGCYHGVIQAYFADRRGGEAGVTPEKLNGLCQPYRGPDKRWLEFQCAHGIGHGVMAVESHHLLKALDACDLLTERFEKEACWGGAFMENVVNATQPHHQSVTQVGDAGEHAGHGSPPAAPPADSAHAAAGHEGHDTSGHEGHDMGAAAEHEGHGAAQPFMALDPREPLYPCTVVQEHHRQACYLMQTSAILYRNNGDFREAARQCERVPERYRNTCFISLGRDANSWGRGSRERAIAYCTAAPAVGQPWCIVGLVKNIVDVTADPNDGLSFCRLAPDNTKPACFTAVGQEIALLQPTAPGREQACRAAATGYVAECRRGAGLPLVPGDG